MKSFTPVWIHPSLRTDALSERKRESLFQGAIDHGFHYRGYKQSQLWLRVHQRHAPAQSDQNFKAIFQQMAKDLAQAFHAQPVHIIGLCSGGGWKESAIMEALHGQGCPVRYTPVDTSLDLTLLSADTAKPWAKAGIDAVAGDISLLQDLPAWLTELGHEETRVYTFFGAAPNFLPSFIFPLLRQALRPQDYLLMSANLVPLLEPSDEAYHAACGKILGQYDNPDTLAWLRQILLDWGIAMGLGELLMKIETLEGLYAFVASSRWMEDASFLWEGERFKAKKGERLRVFFSLRYTLPLLESTLAQYGLKLGEGHVTPCGYEGVWRVSST